MEAGETRQNLFRFDAPAKAKKRNGLLNAAEAAERLGLSIHTIRKYVLFRQIPFVKLGARVLFDPGDLDAFVMRHKVDAIGGHSRRGD